MDLVLLPHHNTISSLQKLQTELRQTSGKGFLAAYPLVCVLGHTDETAAVRGKLTCKPHQILKDMLKDADGTICFTNQIEADAKSGTFHLPVSVPFMDMIQAAGFTPETNLRILLGFQLSARENAGTQPCQELPAPSRSFRLALMETKLLSAGSPFPEAEPAAPFSWKFHLPFWVKLR